MRGCLKKGRARAVKNERIIIALTLPNADGPLSAKRRHLIRSGVFVRFRPVAGVGPSRLETSPRQAAWGPYSSVAETFERTLFRRWTFRTFAKVEDFMGCGLRFRFVGIFHSGFMPTLRPRTGPVK